MLVLTNKKLRHWASFLWKLHDQLFCHNTLTTHYDNSQTLHWNSRLNSQVSQFHHSWDILYFNCVITHTLLEFDISSNIQWQKTWYHAGTKQNANHKEILDGTFVQRMVNILNQQQHKIIHHANQTPTNIKIYANRMCCTINTDTLCQCKHLHHISNQLVSSACWCANNTLRKSLCYQAAVPELVIWVAPKYTVWHTGYCTYSYNYNNLLQKLSTSER